MADRHIDYGSADRLISGASYNGSVDEGAGSVSRDVRVAITGGQFWDIYGVGQHPNGNDSAGTPSLGWTQTGGGTVTGLVRLTYDDTVGPDRILQGAWAIWRHIAVHGRGLGLFATQQLYDEVVQGLRAVIEACAVRLRAEGEIAAN